MNRRINNKMIFFTALSDAFREDENRELSAAGTVELEENANENIMDIFYAFLMLFNVLTESNADPLDFLNILTRLLFQDKLTQEKE